MFYAYTGVDAAQHQTYFNTYSAQGYRMISLNVCGDPSNAQYAAVWIQRAGAAWEAIHNVNSTQFQAFFNTWTAKGYVPTLVSATGDASNAVFAAVMEQGISGPSLTQFGMTSGPAANAGTFQHFNASALSQNMAIASVGYYGAANDPRYIAVWHANPTYVKWHVYPSVTQADFQTVFNQETQLPGYGLAGYRLADVAISSSENYCLVFKDDVVGAWDAQAGLASAAYQAYFNAQVAAGFYPICVAGGGSGNYLAGIFAKQDIPSPRLWMAAGTTVPALAGVDTIMQKFMQANGVRAAQVAISKNGVSKFSRAYSWAEAGYRLTQATDRFLLASCSKMFVEASIQSLYDTNVLKTTTPAYALLGFSNPLDPRSNNITVQQLLDHMGGYDDQDAPYYDPTYDMRNIGLSFNPPRVVAKKDVAAYMYARMLNFTPGTESKYSNYGYLLLTAVIEAVTKMDYYAYLQKSVLTPAGITEVMVMSTLASGRTNNEAISEDQGMNASPLNLGSPLLVPAVYGGDGEIKEVGAGCAGMAASAEALAAFIYKHAVWGNGGRAANSARSGSTPGSSSWAESRGDGIDWSYTINTRDWPANTSQPLSNLATQIDTLLNTAAI